jgi:hypothetical protein
MAEKDIYLSNQLVSVEKYDAETLKLTFKYGSEKLFKIESILNDESLHEIIVNGLNLCMMQVHFLLRKVIMAI